MQPQSHHTVTKAQQNAFTNFVNFFLRTDPDLRYLLPTSADKLFSALADGVIFCKLINMAVPGTIVDAAINLPEGKELSVFKVRENLNLAIASSKSIGCVTTNITVESLSDRREHIMLGLTWQVIESYLLRRIELRYVPQIVMLLEEGEDQQILRKMAPKEILLRWLNWHLKQNKRERKIKNFSKDLSDSEGYLCVFSDISKIDDRAFTYSTEKKAEHVLDVARKTGVNTFVEVGDLVEGRQKLNLMFCAQIFNHKHGLEIKDRKPVLVLEEDDSDNRQLRIYKTWINSMGLEGGQVVHLIEELKTGVVLLKVIEYMKPKTVDWDKAIVATTKLNNRIFCIQNCNYAIELISKTFDCKVVGFGGTEIVDGKIFAVLGILWQLYRIEALNLIGGMKEEELLAWANSRSGQSLKSLRDKSLEDSGFWLKLVNAIDSRVVNFSLVKQKGQEGYLQFNAKYALASARKLGAQVIILWEHISEVNSKFLLIFLAGVYQIDASIKKR